MTQKIINLGTAANKGDGDVLRTAFGKVNDNFTELYSTMGADVQIPNQATHGGKYLTTNGATLSWVAITIPQDTGDLTNNEGFITEASELVNGANTVSLDSQGNLLFTNGEQIKTNFLGGGLELYHSSDNTIGIYDGYARINTFTTGGAKHTWEFDDDGKLTVPGNIARSDPAGLTIGANYNVYIVADQTDNDVTWTFDGSTGSLTLPNTGTITNPSGGGAPTGTIYTFNTDYASGSPTLSAAEYIDLAAGGDADNVETSWVITFANGTTKTVTSRVLTSTPDRQRISWTGELTIFLIADVWPLTIQSADYNAGGTSSLELSPDGTTTWVFGDNGRTTFPYNMLATDSQLIIQSDGETEIRNLSETNGIDIVTNITNGDTRWSFGTDGLLTFPDGESSIYTLDPATSGGINGIAINGKDRTYIGIQNEAFGYGWDFRAFGLSDYSTTLKPAIKFPGSGWLQEDYTDIMNENVPLQLGSQGSITLTARLNGFGATEHNWVFGRDGRTTFPNGTVPEHSYGAAGDKEGMVAFDATYIYYCTADYVDNTTDIWKRTAHGAGTW